MMFSGTVTWVSPSPAPLIKARGGDTVELRTPAGIEQLEVFEIRYGGVDGEAY
jgi:transcription elongation factor GreB